MHMKTVRASEKGQFTLPRDMYKALGESRDLLLVEDGGRIILMAAEEHGRRIIGDLGGWEALATKSLDDVWDNDEDEAWNDA
jgi:bifunctional DNA-binding transcriptional regulator/antitoxin component of YhaV-PrlF toxin-antitoxin module